MPLPSSHQGPQTGTDRRPTIRIVYNPRSARKRERRFQAVLAHLRDTGHDYDILSTSRAGDAARFVRETQPGGADIVAIAGGDGTINDAIQGVGPHTPPLGLIPLGTANVLAHELGIGTQPHRIASALTGSTTKAVRPGLVNGHRFMMMAGVGLDAQVVSGLHRTVKNRFGKAAYLIEVMRTLSQWSCPPIEILAGDDGSKTAASVIVSRGKRYGGTFLLAPGCDLERPQFQLTLFPPGGAFSVFARFLLIPAGLLGRSGLVEQVLVDSLEIAGPAGEPLQADGDIVARLPARLSLCDQVIEILVPRDG